MSFVDSEEDILGLMEELFTSLAGTLFPQRPIQQHPFPRMTFAESMRRFGSDKPDLRYGLELADFAPALKDTGFQVFQKVLSSGGSVRGFSVPGGASWSRKQTDDLITFVQQYGAKGLVTVQIGGEGELAALTMDDVKSTAAKFLTAEQVITMAEAAGATRGDMLLIVADKDTVVNKALDALRREMASRLELADPSTLAFVYVTDVPLFEWSETEGRWMSMHHPFTSPNPEDIGLMESDPGKVRSRAYDLVCNGWELFSGSIRIHQRELQETMFKVLGIGPEEARRKFGHMLEAFEFGAPPHAGIGCGIDRTLAVLLGESDIREVVPFPKTKSASDPMTGAPTTVDSQQLEVLHIKIDDVEPPVTNP
jgi:aspartyl-tRNA synthetase